MTCARACVRDILQLFLVARMTSSAEIGRLRSNACTHARMHACRHECMGACVHLCVYVHACICVCVRVCKILLRMHANTDLSVHTYDDLHPLSLFLSRSLARSLARALSQTDRRTPLLIIHIHIHHSYTHAAARLHAHIAAQTHQLRGQFLDETDGITPQDLFTTLSRHAVEWSLCICLSQHLSYDKMILSPSLSIAIGYMRVPFPVSLSSWDR